MIMRFKSSSRLRARDLTRAECNEIDAVSNGRRQRINGAEMNALMGYNAGYSLLMDAMKDGGLTKLAERSGADIEDVKECLAALKLHYASLETAVSAHQLKSLDAQVDDFSVVVTTGMPPQGYTAVSEADLTALTQAVTKDHCGYMCTRTRDGARSCPVRKALDAIPGMRQYRDESPDACPYSLTDMPAPAEPECERMRLDKDSVTEIGAFLLAARQKAGKSLLDIELDTGMAKQTVSQVENGKTMPRLATLAALADEYGFEIEIREKGA